MLAAAASIESSKPTILIKRVVHCRRERMAVDGGDHFFSFLLHSSGLILSTLLLSSFVEQEENRTDEKYIRYLITLRA